MKLINFIKNELLPLDKRQNLIIIIIISCFFQFALFYAPALAAEAVNEAKAENNSTLNNELIPEEELLSINPLSKSAVMDENIAQALLDNENDEETAGRLPLAETKTYLLNDRGEPLKVVRSSVHAITAYNSEAAQTDDTPCITANGFDVCAHGIEDTVAANFLKFGTKIQIPDLFGDRVFVVRDRMNKRYSDRLDIWMKDKPEARRFGIKTARIYVLE